MSTVPQTSQRWPMITGRRSSVDQRRPPTEKPNISKSKRFKIFRSSEQNGNKGQELGSDNASGKAPNETNTTNGEELKTKTNIISNNQASSRLECSVRNPPRPSYPHQDSGYSGDGAHGMPKSKQTLGNGASSQPAHMLPGFTGLEPEIVSPNFQSEATHTSGSPSVTIPSKLPWEQEIPVMHSDGAEPESRSGPPPQDNQPRTSTELLSENRHLKEQLNVKDNEIDLLRQHRDEAIDKHEKVNADYKLSIADLDTRTEQLRRTLKELEEGKERWANGARLEMQLQDDITSLQTQIEMKDQAWDKWRREVEMMQAERDKLKSVEVQFGELEKDFNQTLEQLEVRNSQLFKAQGDYETLQQKHSETSAELMRVKIESRSDVDDTFFISRYQHLQSDIRTWAQKYFWGEQKKRGVLHSTHNAVQLPSIHDDLEELSEDCLNLLVGSEDGSTRPFVAEAYLWKFIEDKIFHTTRSRSSCSKGMFWAHKLRPEMVRMEKFLHPGPKASDTELRMFYKWKASTAKLVIRRLRPTLERTRIPVDFAVMDYMLVQVLHVLGAWMSKNEKMSRQEDACRRDLAMILQAAIDFDSYVHEEWSRIFATAVPPGAECRYGFKFDDKSMIPGSDSSLTNGELVGTVLSPALIRIGTTNGDYYGKVREVLVSSRVLPQGFWAKTQKPNNAQSGGGVIRGMQQRIRS